jgi:hypothetical protein
VPAAPVAADVEVEPAEALPERASPLHAPARQTQEP